MNKFKLNFGSIKLKIIIFVCSLSVLVLSAVGSISLYSLSNQNEKALVELEKSLRDSFDNLIVTQTQNTLSLIKDIYEKTKRGELSFEEGKKEAADRIRNLRYGKDGYFWIDTIEGVNVVLLGKDAEGKSRIDLKDFNGTNIIREFIENAKNGGGFTDYYFPKAGQETPLPKRGYTFLFEPYQWVVGTGNYTDDIDIIIAEKKLEIKKEYNRTIGILVLASISSIIILMIGAVIFGKKISNPLTQALKNINQIAKGDLTVQIPEKLLKIKDETGEISRAIDHMVKSIKGTIQKSLVIGANLSNEANTQAAAMQETSASLEEMSSMTKQNATNTNEAARIVIESRESVEESNKNMKNLDKSMKAITKSSQDISSIIKVIDEISFQTNILALNAAVEAARAGEAGAGFAVVAEEVRNLSMRSADAAKDIAQLIEETIEKINGAVSIVDIAAKTFDRVSEGSEKVEYIVKEIASATNEQSIGIDQISKAVLEVDKATQRNASNANDLSISMEIFKV